MPIGRATTTSKPVVAAELARQLLGFELGVLIDVAGIERRILVGRRIGDVTVHAAGAAVHHAATPRGVRRLEHVARAVDVDRAIRRVGLPGFAIGRGDVIHDLDALARRGRSRRDPPDRLRPRCTPAAGSGDAIESRAAPAAAPAPAPRRRGRARYWREMSTGEAGRARHENFHGVGHGESTRIAAPARPGARRSYACAVRRM